ncbi:type III PLP-dependent enzyme [Streptomyces fuscichromogenes]|uniref:Diaminopimelate decarboxylase n=1 Tax=Streptomyces fuscichromogenes TaxID=1324013 RepID=A0A917UF99_9ACTN|nr:type III PLP-dependent enzyme [Streptomyces fuscichromogenes]GGM88758.1 diaminopimelate decarboxylase [Streptomyces fuscichromogenes]
MSRDTAVLADGVPRPLDHAGLRALAERFGTPSYVYDLAALREAATALRADLPAGAELLYSVKANPHPLVIRELAACGLRTEISSLGELAAVRSAGARLEDALYTGPGKTPGELRSALGAGVRQFSVESLADRDRLARACRDTGTQAEYLVRLNGPRGSRGGSLRMTGRPTAFGTDWRARDDLAALFASAGPARPIGTHTFSATNVEDPQALAVELRQSLATSAEVARSAGFVPELLDLGGGFPAPMAQPGPLRRFPALAGTLAAALDAHFPGRGQDGGPRVAFETGRHLTAAAGTLLTTVVDVKRSGDRTFVVLDSGVNVLGGMSGLGRLMAPRTMPVPVLPAEGAGPAVLAASGPGGASTVRASLVGPLCTPLDMLNPAVELADPRPGQLLAVPNTGAYGLTASLVGFLSRPAPVEITVDGPTLVAARQLKLQTTEVEAND